MNSMFGFELFQKLYHNDIHKKEDVIMLFVHWYLTRFGFKCLGNGDETVFDASERGSELLPAEWSLHPNYALRYIKYGKLYILFGIKSDSDLLLNLMRYHDDTVFNSCFLSIEETVSALHGPFEIIIPSYRTMLHNLQRDFVISTCYDDATTQTEETNQLPIRNEEHIVWPNRAFTTPPYDPPARVGVRDLDPLREGGGMIFDPFERRRLIGRSPRAMGVPGVLPPNAIPPGARFDPLGPPLDLPSQFRRRPDDDHLPPPGYDDMFL